MPTKTRRDELLDFIIQYAREKNGPTPTIREIAETFRLSYSTTYNHVQHLIREQRLDWIDGKLVIPGARWIAPQRTVSKRMQINRSINNLRGDAARHDATRGDKAINDEAINDETEK